jgi:hypothetical protein
MTANAKKAIPLRSVDGASLSTDGSMTFFQVTTDKDGQYIWALPSDQLPGMMVVVSAMADQAARVRGGDPEARQAMQVEKWTMARNEDGNLWMSLTFVGGATTTVLMPPGSPIQMHKILRQMLEKPEAEPATEEQSADTVH